MDGLFLYKNRPLTVRQLLIKRCGGLGILIHQ
jgi:hypothetical protein